MSLRNLMLGMTAVVAACGGSRGDQAASGDSSSSATPSAEVAAAPDTTIVVNGVVLSDEILQQLQQLYPVPIAPGRYWYDAVSGAYGYEGAPVSGQISPGLALGGELAADASRGTSDTYINGRRLTTGEVAYLERLCQQPVETGRFWVTATGVGGREGGPAYFNLAACPGVPQQSSGPRTMSRTYCDPNGACTSTGILGSITTTP